MEYINIQNLQFRNMDINFLINKQEIFAVYSQNQKKTADFLLILNGINSNNGSCLYQSEDIFDNKEFFKQRIYFDFNEIYLKTMNAEFIEESLMNRFSASFDKDIFNKYVQTMGTRLECVVKSNYTFTKAGNTMVNFALFKALDKPYITINNPTIHLENAKIIETITTGLIDKNQYEVIILGLDSIKNFKDKLDKVLILSDYETYYVIDPKKDSFLLIADDVHLHDRVFNIKQNNLIICLNNYTKEELKRFNSYKIKYSKLTFYELGAHLGESNE